MSSVLPDRTLSKIATRGFAVKDFLTALLCVLLFAAAVWGFSWLTGTSYRLNLLVMTPAMLVTAAAFRAQRRTETRHR